MKDKKLKGIITPVLTPFNHDGSIAHDLYQAHCGWLVNQGSDYISPFGTTGEALSLSLSERKQCLMSLVESKAVSADQLMPGTGLCSLPETLELTQLAVELGCKAVMTLPPFFYKNASDDGLYAYFDQLIEKVNSQNLKICLYHIPPMAGMGFSPQLTKRLTQAFPETVVAYKDSSGDWDNTQAIIDAAPDMSVFPGSESFLLQGLQNGGSGCISATCNLNVNKIREVYDLYHSSDTHSLAGSNERMLAFRKHIQDAGLISIMKAILAIQTADKRWNNVRFPLLASDQEKTDQIMTQLGEQLSHLG